jgi:hypothetical protein
MGMQTDVKSSHVEANAQAITGRVRIKGYQCLSGGVAGDIIFYDTASNTATGTIRLQFNVPANTNNPFGNLIPGEGILFENGVYITRPANATVTTFYG